VPTADAHSPSEKLATTEQTLSTDWAELVPTAPGTPQYQHQLVALELLGQASDAPAWTQLPLTPTRTAIKKTPDDLAEERLTIMLARELAQRAADPSLRRLLAACADCTSQESMGLSIVPTNPQDIIHKGASRSGCDHLSGDCDTWASEYGVNDDLRRQCVRWILEVSTSTLLHILIALLSSNVSSYII
jgi:hypothetical protein